LAYCSSLAICEPLHALCRTATRSKGKGNAFALHWWIFLRLFSSLVISLLRKLSSYYTLTIIGSSKWRQPPTIGTHWPASQRMLFWRSSTASPLAPCSAINMYVVPRNASSRQP
jgi:hypothetical protein